MTPPPSSAAKVKRDMSATVTEHRLRNGLRVLLCERHLDPVVAVMTWYGVGARNEREHEAGVSHFLEHMMFKGTPAMGKGEVDLITTQLGGSNNAFTTPDHTAYWFELASDRWEAALEIEADRMRNLLLDPPEFDAEKAVVLEELSMGLDDPWRSLSRQVQEVLFLRHPYGRPVIGFEDTLAAMGPEDMRDYYARFYHPGNATLVVCGDIRSGPALREIRRLFGTIPRGPAFEEADCFRHELEEPKGERRLVTRWDDPAARIVMAWPTTKVCTPEDYALDVVTTLLTGGRLGTLYRSLVLDQALATYVATNNDTRVDGGAFWLYAEAVQGVEAATLEAAIDVELAKIAEETVSAADLKRAKSTLAAGEAYERETVSDLAENLGEYAVDAEWERALDLTERRSRVRAKDVRDAARNFLRSERRVVGWSLPEGGDA